MRDDYRLVTFPVAHGVSAVGYALEEDPRPGRFDVQAADALGVPPGPNRGALQRGEAVTLPDGRTITPDKVLGPARAGRKIVIAGDGGPAESVIEASRGAEVLVHKPRSARTSAIARETGHSTALEAAGVARAADVRLLALTHLSNRYFGRRSRARQDGLPEGSRAQGLRYDRRPIRRAR